jgi:xyloglucan:xyloglucosyl transferase
MCVILFLFRFLVDNVPIRVFKNNQNLGVPYLNSQAMAVYTSLWDGSQWATEGGRVKIDWQYAPFIATYEGFNVDGCAVQNNDNLAGCAVASSNKWAQAPALTWHQTNQLKWVRQRYLVYNYCTDKTRYPTPPPECGTSVL